MSDPVKKASGRPRSVQSHQAILQGTLELLSEVGFDRISIEAVATRAGVGKTTIYRRYSSKEELVADAIESVREEVIIPDTGSLWEDISTLIDNAAEIVLNPLGRQAIAMIISTASSSPQFVKIYWTKYLQPRRQAFAIVLERAKARNELHPDVDSDLVFDTMSGIMLYALIFPPTDEPWKDYICRALDLVLRKSVISS
jgi:AcrR family transcriptional regulator